MPGEAKEHPGRGETSDGHRSNDVRDKGAKIAARAAALQEEASARRDRGKLSHQASIPEANAGIALQHGLGIRILHYRE